MILNETLTKLMQNNEFAFTAICSIVIECVKNHSIDGTVSKMIDKRRNLNEHWQIPGFLGRN